GLSGRFLGPTSPDQHDELAEEVGIAGEPSVEVLQSFRVALEDPNENPLEGRELGLVEAGAVEAGQDLRDAEVEERCLLGPRRSRCPGSCIEDLVGEIRVEGLALLTCWGADHLDGGKRSPVLDQLSGRFPRILASHEPAETVPVARLDLGAPLCRERPSLRLVRCGNQNEAPPLRAPPLQPAPPPP